MLIDAAVEIRPKVFGQRTPAPHGELLPEASARQTTRVCPRPARISSQWSPRSSSRSMPKDAPLRPSPPCRRVRLPEPGVLPSPIALPGHPASRAPASNGHVSCRQDPDGQRTVHVHPHQRPHRVDAGLRARDPHPGRAVRGPRFEPALPVRSVHPDGVPFPTSHLSIAALRVQVPAVLGHVPYLRPPFAAACCPTRFRTPVATVSFHSGLKIVCAASVFSRPKNSNA